MFYIERGSDVTIAGLTFESGSASSEGGCMFVEASTVEVQDVEFIKCEAVSALGAYEGKC